MDDLHILKEWESNESEMLQKFIADSTIASSYPFDFIPVGNNLDFERKFLLAKSEKHKKLSIDILSGPYIDLKSVLTLMNRGEFKNSGLDKMTGKEQSGHDVPKWYDENRFDRIEEYVVQETREFVRLYRWLHGEMPRLHAKFVDSELGNPDQNARM